MTRQIVWILLAFAMAFTNASVRAQTPTDAISREFTAYVDNTTNPTQTDATSREFTIYVGNQPLRTQTDAVTREFTVYVDSAGPGPSDAITREFTVYVGNQPLRTQTDAVSREFTVDVDANVDFWRVDAVSREFTIYVGNQPLRVQTDCWSREFTVTTYPPGRADLSCDNAANGLDIPFFIFALLDPAGFVAAYPFCDINRADMDLNGVVDLADVEPFVSLLLGS